MCDVCSVSDCCQHPNVPRFCKCLISGVEQNGILKGMTMHKYCVNGDSVMSHVRRRLTLFNGCVLLTKRYYTQSKRN